MELEEYRKNLELTEIEEWRRDTFIPLEERKTILLIADDLRLPSGVGSVSKEIMLHTIHHYNIIQIAGAIKHPEQGNIVDISQQVKEQVGFEVKCKLYPTSGYGDQDMIRFLINNENINAIMIFTDPRFFIWFFHMEHEIRQMIPIVYYNIWDDLPVPLYNRNYYASCDALFAISKQTYNINKQCLGEENVQTIRNSA